MDNLDNCDKTTPRVNHYEDLKPRRSSMAKPGLFQRFVESFLPPKTSEAPEFSRKVCLHKENAEFVQGQLEAIKADLEAEIDDELRPMITEVIDPMLRDVVRINRIMKRENGELAAIKQFKAWTEGATLWVELYSKQKDKEAIKSAIVKHIISKSLDRIDKDIKFIEDYFDQALSQLTVPTERLAHFRAERSAALSPYIELLQSLKMPPDALTIDCVSRWRRELDLRRAEHFHRALQVIDYGS